MSLATDSCSVANIVSLKNFQDYVVPWANKKNPVPPKSLMSLSDDNSSSEMF
jgi:hypothetical protein